MHDRLRASCMLPFHIAWLPRTWQSEADLRRVARRQRGEPPDLGLVARFGVLAAGSVTGFTCLIGLRRRRPRVLGFAVQRRVQALAFALVTGGAGVVADEAVGWTRRRRRRRSSRRLRDHPDRRGGLSADGDKRHHGRPQAHSNSHDECDPNAMNTHEFTVAVHGQCQLLNGVTRFAVLTDLLAVLRLVIVVVAAEAARRVDVADVVRIGAEGDLHLRKHVAAVDVLDGLYRAIDIGIA